MVGTVLSSTKKHVMVVVAKLGPIVTGPAPADELDG